MPVTIVVLVTRSSGKCDSGPRPSVQEYAHVTAIVADGNYWYLRQVVQYNVRTLQDASEAFSEVQY